MAFFQHQISSVLQLHYTINCRNIHCTNIVLIEKIALQEQILNCSYHILKMVFFSCNDDQDCSYKYEQRLYMCLPTVIAYERAIIFNCSENNFYQRLKAYIINWQC